MRGGEGLIVEGQRPCQPWGAEPPPAPAAATRAQKRRVDSAWRTWSHFRPYYTREGDSIRAEVDIAIEIWPPAPIRRWRQARRDRGA